MGRILDQEYFHFSLEISTRKLWGILFLNRLVISTSPYNHLLIAHLAVVCTQSRAEVVQFGRDAQRSLKSAQRTLAQQKEAAKPQRSAAAATAAVRANVVAATNALSGRAKTGMDV